jgi:hypothetical protein
MIETLLPLAARYWWVAIVAAALLFASVQSSRLAAANVGLERAAEHLADCRLATLQARAERDTLRDAVAAQNSAVEALKAEGDTRAKKAAQAVAQARRGQDSAMEEAGRLAALKPTGDACLEAARVLRGDL